MFGTGILRNPRKTGLMDHAIRIRQWLTPLPEELAIFHITHQKAGSQWINRILHALCYNRLVLPEVESVPTHERPLEGVQFLKKPVRPGSIYPTLYLTREEFNTVPLPRHHRRFIVIRDPRDTMVSAYFSYKVSHTAQLRLDERLPDRAEPDVDGGRPALHPRQLAADDRELPVVVGRVGRGTHQVRGSARR